MTQQKNAGVTSTTQRWRSRIGVGINAFSILAFALIVGFLIWGGSPYPYTDDWMLVPFGMGQTPVTLSWLWEQHVDHRIPIPKALWVWSLWISDMDFRSIMLLNAALAFVANFFLLKAVATYRGHLRLGDLIIPLILLNPAFNIFQWGFYLQFMSSITLALLAMALGCLHASAPTHGYGIAAAIVIFCLNGVGMNGTVMALIFAPTLAAAVTTERFATPRRQYQIIQSLCVATVLIAIYVVGTWSPSDATSQTAEAIGPLEQVGAVMQAIFALSMPRAWSDSLLPQSVYLAMGIALSAVAGIAGVVRLLRPGRSGPIILFGTFVAGWAVISAITVGRAGFWSPGLEYHYGYFPVLTVVAGWMLVSYGGVTTWMTRLSSVILLLVFGTMYADGVHWGLDRAETRGAQLSQIRTDLASDRPLEEIARDNIALFWWQHNDAGIALVTENLRLLQNNGHLRP